MTNFAAKQGGRKPAGNRQHAAGHAGTHMGTHMGTQVGAHVGGPGAHSAHGHPGRRHAPSNVPAVQPPAPRTAAGRERSLWRRSMGKLQALTETEADAVRQEPVIPEAMVAQARGLEREDLARRLRGDRPSTPPGLPPGHCARSGKELWSICRVRVKHMQSLKHLWGDARKLYGHETRQYETKDTKLKKQLKGRRCFLLPSDRARIYWDLVQVPLLLYIAVMTPLREGYGVSIAMPSAASPCCSASFVSELLIDLYFVVDIVLNFRTAYLDDAGELVVDASKVSRHYLKRWFMLDFLSILPVSYIGMIMQRSGAEYSDDDDADGKLKFMKMLRLFRLAKMLRLARLKRLLERYDDTWQELQGASQLLKSVMLCLFCAHLIGCAWYALGETSQTLPSGYVVYGWVKDHEMNNGWDANTTLATKYITSTYWALTTLTTVGYGDILPYTDAERLFTIICMLVGVIFFGAMVGTLGTWINQSKPHVEMYRSNMAEIRDFLQLKGLPRSTRLKILSFYDHKFKAQTVFSEQVILNELPPSMRHDLIADLYRDLIEAVPLFHGLPDDVIHMICLCLHPMPVQKGDVIIKQGAIGTEMYIVKSGEVKVTMKNDAPGWQWECFVCHKSQPPAEAPFKCECRVQGSCDFCAADKRAMLCESCASDVDGDSNVSNEIVLGYLQAGSFFGEGPMVGAGEGAQRNLRTRTVTASQDTTLYYLTKYDIDEVASMHSQLSDHLEQFAVKRDRRDRRGKTVGSAQLASTSGIVHGVQDEVPDLEEQPDYQKILASAVSSFRSAQPRPTRSNRSSTATLATARTAQPRSTPFKSFGEQRDTSQETDMQRQSIAALETKIDGFQGKMDSLCEKVDALLAAGVQPQLQPITTGGVLHCPNARRFSPRNDVAHEDSKEDDGRDENWLRAARLQAPVLAARLLDIDMRVTQFRAAELQHVLSHAAPRPYPFEGVPRLPEPEPEPEPEPAGAG